MAVFSNAASHRMRDDVPLLIPEVNPEHLNLIKAQTSFKDGGFIVTNANCSTTGLAPPMKAMQDAFGLSSSVRLHLPGRHRRRISWRPSLDILGNVVPYIKGEEEKMEAEMLRCSASSQGRHQGRQIRDARLLRPGTGHQRPPGIGGVVRQGTARVRGDHQSCCGLPSRSRRS